MIEVVIPKRIKESVYKLISLRNVFIRSFYFQGEIAERAGTAGPLGIYGRAWGPGQPDAVLVWWWFSIFLLTWFEW